MQVLLDVRMSVILDKNNITRYLKRDVVAFSDRKFLLHCFIENVTPRKRTWGAIKRKKHLLNV